MHVRESLKNRSFLTVQIPSILCPGKSSLKNLAFPEDERMVSPWKRRSLSATALKDGPSTTSPGKK